MTFFSYCVQHLLFGLTSLALVILGGVLVNQLSNRLESDFHNEIVIYGHNSTAKDIIDKTQKAFKCCGAQDLSSWKALSFSAVPESCCVAPGSKTCRETIAALTSGSNNITGILHTEVFNVFFSIVFSQLLQNILFFWLGVRPKAGGINQSDSSDPCHHRSRKPSWRHSFPHPLRHDCRTAK